MHRQTDHSLDHCEDHLPPEALFFPKKGNVSTILLVKGKWRNDNNSNEQWQQQPQGA